mmetsp:Transcript_45657/g.145402  ORF Transcript_45657/g.145402 Transcript_45657/m.145402 type:complete len:291 (+) Transcript_45657:2177-3049(+)
MSPSPPSPTSCDLACASCCSLRVIPRLSMSAPRSSLWHFATLSGSKRLNCRAISSSSGSLSATAACCCCCCCLPALPLTPSALSSSSYARRCSCCFSCRLWMSVSSFSLSFLSSFSYCDLRLRSSSSLDWYSAWTSLERLAFISAWRSFMLLASSLTFSLPSSAFLRSRSFCSAIRRSFSSLSRLVSALMLSLESASLSAADFFFFSFSSLSFLNSEFFCAARASSCSLRSSFSSNFASFRCFCFRMSSTRFLVSSMRFLRASSSFSRCRTRLYSRCASSSAARLASFSL